MFLPIWTTQHGTHNMATYQGKIDSSMVVTQFLHVTHVIREVSDDPEMSSETFRAHCCILLLEENRKSCPRSWGQYWAKL